MIHQPLQVLCGGHYQCSALTSFLCFLPLAVVFISSDLNQNLWEPCCPPWVSRELEVPELWGPTPVLLLGGSLPITARGGTLKGQLPASNRMMVILKSNLISKICPCNQTSSLYLSCFPYNFSGFPGSTSLIGHLLWHLYLSICFWGTHQNRWTIYWTFQRWEREPRGPEHLNC